MIAKRSFQTTAGRGSYGLALFFALIAVIGLFLMYSSPPGVSEKKPSGEQGSPKKTVVLEDEEKETVESRYSGYMLRTVLVAAVIVISLFVAAKWYRHRMQSDISNRLRMEIIGRKYIGPKHYLLMVTVENRRLLLGITDNTINLISTYDGDDVETVLEDRPPEKLKSFGRVLQRLKVNKENNTKHDEQ